MVIVGHLKVTVYILDYLLDTLGLAITVGNFVKLRQGSGKDRQGMAVKAKGLKA